MIKRARILAAAAVAAVSLSTQALAQQPNRTIRFVVPFAAGGGVDAMCRLLAQQLQEGQGIQTIVENRGGSNGTIGGSAVMQAAPDGATLLFSGAPHVMVRHVMSKAPYDPITDFTAIARVGEAPLVVVIAPKLPQNNLKEIVEYARANPKSWTNAVPTLGAPGHLATLLYAKLGNVTPTILAFRGTAPAANDVAGGHVQMLIDAGIALIPMAKSGTVKGIAITSAKRSALAPDLPTAAESGMPGLEYVSWYGVFGPKGMAPELVATLNRNINDAIKELAKGTRLTTLGIEPVIETTDQFQRYIAADLARNGELLKAANFKPE